LLSANRYHEISKSTHSTLNPLSLDPPGRTFDIVASMGTSSIDGVDKTRAVAADDAQAQNV